jgi:hypothetical protein
MMLTDDDLLDFSGSSLSIHDALRLLEEHGDVYRAQLVAACWLEDCRKRRQANSEEVAWPRRTNADHEAGFQAAASEMIAHLRQGDFLPGSDSYPDPRRS